MSVRNRILEVLSSTDDKMSTAMISSKVGNRKETVYRHLSDMKDEGILDCKAVRRERIWWKTMNEKEEDE